MERGLSKSAQSEENRLLCAFTAALNTVKPVVEQQRWKSEGRVKMERVLVD